MTLWRILGIVVLLIAAGGGYYGYTNYLRVQTVTASIVTQAPVSEAIYGTGTVEPQRWAKVVPLQRRRLVELCSCEGQNVRVGQVLGRQDDAEERSALQELQVSNQQAQRDLDRAEKDRGKNDAAQTEYEQRWTQLEESKTRIAAQRVRIDALVLRAPLDGMVLRRDGEVGEIAGPTDVLFWVGPPTPMQVVAEVNEEEINRIAVGQKALLRSEAFWPTAILLISSSLTSATTCIGVGGPTQNSTSVGPAISPTSPSRRSTMPSSGARSTSASMRAFWAAMRVLDSSSWVQRCSYSVCAASFLPLSFSARSRSRCACWFVTSSSLSALRSSASSWRPSTWPALTFCPSQLHSSISRRRCSGTTFAQRCGSTVPVP